MADTLFAISFLVGEGGDGCSSIGMNRISGDARRLFDPALSSPFGLQMRDQGFCTAQYNPTGRGALPPYGPVTKREMWERVFMRFRKFPTSGSPDPIVWALKGTIEGSPALCIRVSAGGTLSLYNQGNATAPGELLGSVGVPLDVWYCVEVYVRFNNATQVLPDPPYENNAYVSWRINSSTISNSDRIGLNPQYGIDRRNQEAIQSQLGDGTNLGKGLEIDYADWIADGAGWVGNTRRVAVLRGVGAGTYTDWTGGNTDYRHQIDFPFVGSGIALGVSTQSAGASQSYAVESAESKGIDGVIYSARIAVFFATVGGDNINLILRRNDSDTFYGIGGPAQAAWSSWRIGTSGWLATDTLEVGVQNSASPTGTTSIAACALLVEHDTAGVSEDDQDRAVRIIETTYTGNGTQQSISLVAIDPDVASLSPCVVLIFPESGTSPGAWWWDSKTFPSACNNAGAVSYALIPQAGVVHVTGSGGSTNQNSLAYRLIACFDPLRRIIARGAVALPSGSDNRDVALPDSEFSPEGIFIARESAPTNDSTKIYFRGAGHSGDQSVSLGVDTAVVANAVQSVQAGSFQVGTLINEATQDFGFMAWRTAPFTGKRLVAIMSYAGNASNPRTIALGLDGGTPIFALVVPTNNGKRWTRYGAVTRQWNGATIGSANAITAFGTDSLTVGSELNANGVTYSVFAIAAGVDDTPVLNSVSFDAGWQLQKDDGSGAYADPQWQGAPLREYPYLMKEGLTLRIKNAQILIPNHVAGATYLFRGTGPGGINVPNTAASVLTGDLFEINNVDASAAFPSGATAFYNTFDIAWEVSRDGGTTWQAAGISRNPMYVCLSGTGPTAVTLYHSVVHLACSNVGATNQDEAVAHTWSLFSNRTVKTWDGRTLQYYRPGSSFGDNLFTVLALLQNGTGQCLSWAHMLQDAWTINGVGINSDSPGSSYYTVATCTLGANSYFWVKDWTATPPNNEWFYFESLEFDMQPEPPDGRYGHYDNGAGVQFKNEPTLPGQNSGADAPSQKVFGNHQFIKYTNLAGTATYYDPSYGATYTAAANFQSLALVGYGAKSERFPPGNPQKTRLEFNPVGGATIVSFDH